MSTPVLFKDLSPTMREALLYANSHGGGLHRYPGGFWSRHDWPGKAERYWGSSTVQALVTRGFCVFDDWKERKYTRSQAALRSPIRVSLTDAGRQAIRADL
jgi:hypothetical protein